MGARSSSTSFASRRAVGSDVAEDEDRPPAASAQASTRRAADGMTRSATRPSTARTGISSVVEDAEPAAGRRQAPLHRAAAAGRGAASFEDVGQHPSPRAWAGTRRTWWPGAGWRSRSPIRPSRRSARRHSPCAVVTAESDEDERGHGQQRARVGRLREEDEGEGGGGVAGPVEVREAAGQVDEQQRHPGQPEQRRVEGEREARGEHGQHGGQHLGQHRPRRRERRPPGPAGRRAAPPPPPRSPPPSSGRRCRPAAARAARPRRGRPSRTGSATFCPPISRVTSPRRCQGWVGSTRSDGLARSACRKRPWVSTSG